MYLIYIERPVCPLSPQALASRDAFSCDGVGILGGKITNFSGKTKNIRQKSSHIVQKVVQTEVISLCKGQLLEENEKKTIKTAHS